MTSRNLVVVGGSIAGLMAAAVASEHFDRVTVLERDVYPDGPEPRGGVPQGTQVHVILPLGLKFIEAVLPGIRDTFIAAGCLEFDELAEVPMMSETGWKLRVASASAVAFRRPLFEHIIRRRVLTIPNIAVQHGSARGLVLDGGRVVGIRLRDGSILKADFAIDASGRRSKVARWLEEFGFTAPEEIQANAFMGYATQFVRIPPGVLDDVLGIISHPIPGHHKGGVLLPADNGVHQLSAVGMMRDYPPRDRDGFLDFLDQARSPLLGHVARQCEPVSDIMTYHQEGNLRRVWEKTVLPSRLLIVGDAVASFNPIYGQGMTLASSCACALGEELRASDELDTLGSRVQARLVATVEAAFSMSGEVDALFEGAECVNFCSPSDEQREYAAAIDELATVDPEVAHAIGIAAFWIEPEALRTESIRRKVDRWLAGDRQPANTDPGRYPAVVTSLPMVGEEAVGAAS